MAVQDTITASIIILFLLVGSVVGAFMLTKVLNGLVDTGAYDATTSATISGVSNKWFTYTDYGIAIWFFLLWVVGLLLAYYNETSRTFFIMYVLLFLFSFFPLLTFGSFLSSFVDGFEEAFNQMPITSTIIQFWPMFILFFGATIGLALYAKSSQGGTLVG